MSFACASVGEIKLSGLRPDQRGGDLAAPDHDQEVELRFLRLL